MLAFSDACDYLHPFCDRFKDGLKNDAEKNGNYFDGKIGQAKRSSSQEKSH